MTTRHTEAERRTALSQLYRYLATLRTSDRTSEDPELRALFNEFYPVFSQAYLDGANLTFDAPKT